MKAKDILLSYDGRPVKTIADLEPLYEAALKGLPDKSKAALEVMRQGRRMQFVLNYLEDTEKEVLE